MSFSLSTTATIGEDSISDLVDAAVDEQLEQAATHGYDSNFVNAKALGVIELAKGAAEAIAGAIAREGDVVSISINGHANPTKDPVAGWADNALTVVVTQRARKEEPS